MEGNGEADGKRGPVTLWIGRILGPAFLLATLTLPPPPEMGPDAWRVAGLALLMATWWVTEVVPLPVTALLPLPLLPLLQLSTMEEAAAPFANPVIFLFMGGFMIAQAMQRWELHRRIAFGIIERTGTGPLRIVAGFMIASAFLSMWVSNTAVAVMMLPIGVSIIQVLDAAPDGSPEPEKAEGGGDSPPGGDGFSPALLLGIAYACSIGGAATLIGTPPNALLAGFLADEYDIRIGFAQWMAVGLPLTLLLLPLAWLLLTKVVFRLDPGGASVAPGVFRELRAELGALSVEERRVGWIFSGTAAAWMLRPLLERWVPGLTDAGIAMAATLILFLVPTGGRTAPGPLLNWDWARRIPWGVLLLFGGGLSLAGAITRSGLADWLGSRLLGAEHLPLLALLAVIAGLIVFLTELTSNTASAAAFIPIVAALAVALAWDPLLLTVPVALAASCAFMLPVATPPNAIVFGSGRIRMAHMVRAGVLLNLLVTVLVPLVSVLTVHFVFGVPLTPGAR